MTTPETNDLPSRGYTKLDSGIIHSSIWTQGHEVLRVWIALLALADASGFVRCSLPALAHLCRIKIKRTEQILTGFEEPDPYSRIQDFEGRKIKAVEGGWLIWNYTRYRATCQRKYSSNADRQKAYRARNKQLLETAANKK